MAPAISLSQRMAIVLVFWIVTLKDKLWDAAYQGDNVAIILESIPQWGIRNLEMVRVAEGETELESGEGITLHIIKFQNSTRRNLEFPQRTVRKHTHKDANWVI